MSATRAKCMAGTQVSFASVDSPAVFTHLGEITNITKTGQKLETDDATNHDSTSGYREYIGTIKDGGEWTLDYNFVPADAGQAALSSRFEAKKAINWRIELPNNDGTFTFAALVTEFGNFALPVDKRSSSSLKLKVTGPVYESWGS